MTTEAKAVADLALDTTDRAQTIIAGTTDHGEALTISQTVRRSMDGSETVERRTNEYTLAAPFRPRGTTNVRSVDSLIKIADMFAEEQPGRQVAFNYLDQRSITVIHNYLGGWGDHRAVYVTEPTPEWAAWQELDGRMMNQTTFAELLQDLRHTIVEPDAADIVQIARTFTATKKAHFESGVRLESGDVQFSFAEETQAKAGPRGGTVEIPETITLNLPLFRDSFTTSKVTLEFRYDASPDGLKLGYRIERKAALIETAWAELVDQAKDGLKCEVLDGPAPASVDPYN